MQRLISFTRVLTTIWTGLLAVSAALIIALSGFSWGAPDPSNQASVIRLGLVFLAWSMAHAVLLTEWRRVTMRRVYGALLLVLDATVMAWHAVATREAGLIHFGLYLLFIGAAFVLILAPVSGVIAIARGDRTRRPVVAAISICAAVLPMVIGYLIATATCESYVGCDLSVPLF